MLDADGRPVKRNFVHVERPGRRDARRRSTTRRHAGRPSTSAWTSRSTTASWATTSPRRAACRTVEIRTPYHSTWLDNTKAKFLLGWRPRYDLARLVDAAWSYERAADEPRVVWYPG